MKGMAGIINDAKAARFSRLMFKINQTQRAATLRADFFSVVTATWEHPKKHLVKKHEINQS